MVFAALAASVALVIYSGTRAFATIGPSRAVATADGSLFLLSHGRIHEFGSDGMRRASMDLAALGAPARPSDFERHADGRILVTNPDAPELVRCAWPAGPCERLPVDIRALPAQEVLPLNAAKLHIDEAGGRYFVSDNAGHTVLATDFTGRALHRSRTGVVRHPNQLALTAPDRLVVVDTDRRRFVTLDPERGLAITGVVPLEAPMVARPGHRLPFDHVRLPDGKLGVLLARVGMKDADLVFFDPAGTALSRAALRSDSDPFDIETWRGAIWVADATRYRFDSVRFDGSRGPRLEDAAFLAELEAESRAALRWKEVREAARVAIVAIPLLGALVLWRLGAPATVPVATPALVDTPGIRWVEPRPELVRRARLVGRGFGWLSLAVIVAWCAIFMSRFRDVVFSVSGVSIALPALALLVLLGLALFAVFLRLPGKLMSVRLGIGADALHYVVPGPLVGSRVRHGAAPWREVFYDGFRLLAGRHLVPLGHPGRWQYFEPAVIEELKLRIPAENVVTGSALLLRALRRLL